MIGRHCPFHGDCERKTTPLGEDYGLIRTRTIYRMTGKFVIPVLTIGNKNNTLVIGYSRV
ncbi:hypothetical protein MUO66_05150 [Candidatus Bathyarchaeota archaeon]|nr:hypothetical protein [Candidatus Bathyarchaeota archaeon]